LPSLPQALSARVAPMSVASTRLRVRFTQTASYFLQ
jgi:hypothetical protein